MRDLVSVKTTAYEYRYVSIDRDVLTTVIDNHRSRLEDLGVDFKGPIPSPNFVAAKFPDHLEDELPSWLLQDYTVEELEMLRDVGRAYSTEQRVCIFIRRLVVSDDRAVRALAEAETPNVVQVSVTSEETNIPSTTNAPYTYDPGTDHVTDVDFDAQN